MKRCGFITVFILALTTFGCCHNSTSTAQVEKVKSEFRYRPPVYQYIDDITFTNELDNLAYGILSSGDVVLDRIGYANGYSKSKKQPYWVSYRLTREKATTKIARRSNDFRPDSLVKDSPTPQDYRGSGYDRGHIAPAADMSWNKRAMRNSFYMTNMSPQTPMFNRGIWRLLEEWVRQQAITNGSVYVYTGPIFKTNFPILSIGFSKVEVPDAYYKVLMAETEPKKMIGFVLKNEPNDHSLAHFVCTVDHVEELTGLDFFPDLPYDVQTNLESHVELDKWQLK